MSKIHTSVVIHPGAIVHQGAEIGEGCEIGSYSIIGPFVVLGRRNWIGPHVVMEGRTQFGDENRIFQFASVGSEPQDLKFKGEHSLLRVGNQNTIREYVTLQPGTEGGGMQTTIGNRNLFMVGSHVGHDARIGDSNVIANYCSLAGHVTVGSRATLGGLCGIHQFVRLGDLCILGAGSMVSKDVPPFCTAHGDHAELRGLNRIGLERAGMSSADRMRLKQLYREVFFGDGVLTDRVTALRAECRDFEIGHAFLEFLAHPSSRGIMMPRRKVSDSSDE